MTIEWPHYQPSNISLYQPSLAVRLFWSLSDMLCLSQRKLNKFGDKPIPAIRLSIALWITLQMACSFGLETKKQALLAFRETSTQEILFITSWQPTPKFLQRASFFWPPQILHTCSRIFGKNSSTKCVKMWLKGASAAGEPTILT